MTVSSIKIGEVATASDILLVAQNTSGSYTGDGASSRAVPHGCGAKPHAILISCQTNEKYSFIIHDTHDAALYYRYLDGASTTSAFGEVASMGITNFYVGGSVGDAVVANASANVYHWTVIH